MLEFILYIGYIPYMGFIPYIVENIHRFITIYRVYSIQRVYKKGTTFNKLISSKKAPPSYQELLCPYSLANKKTFFLISNKPNNGTLRAI